MRIGAGDAECGCGGNPLPVVGRPRRQVFARRNPWLSQSISGLALVGMQGGRYRAVLGGDQNLGQTQRAAGGLARGPRWTSPIPAARRAGFGVAVSLRQRPQFGAVTEPGSGAMPLDHPDFVGPNSRLRDGATKQADLRGAVGGGQPGAAAIVVDRAGTHLGENPPAVAQRGSTRVAAQTSPHPPPRPFRWHARCRAGSGRRRTARAVWRTRRRTRASPSHRLRRPARGRSRRF